MKLALKLKFYIIYYRYVMCLRIIFYPLIIIFILRHLSTQVRINNLQHVLLYLLLMFTLMIIK